MNKKLITALVATTVWGMTTALAANPFSDVTPNDWAYQSVSQLVAAGVINGYPDGTFRGNATITRYEMAQMVAKAMANQNRANTEQQALINRLANEFASELNTLGVRVSALERNMGNVKIGGDIRLRYINSEVEAAKYRSSSKSRFDYRGHIVYYATINDRTTAIARFSTGDVEFGNASGRGTSTAMYFDRAGITKRVGNYGTWTTGGFTEFVGAGLLYDDVLVGTNVGYDNGRVKASVSYGFMGVPMFRGRTADTNESATIAQLSTHLNADTTVGGFYFKGNNNSQRRIYGFHANTKLGDKVSLAGEWLKSTEMDQSQAWVATLGYGTYDIEKKGSWATKLQYFDEDVHSPIISTTWNQGYTKDYKGWMATVDYAIDKNVGFTAYYGFNGKKQSGDKRSNVYSASVTYQF